MNTLYQLPFIGAQTFSVSYSHDAHDFGEHWHGELEILYLLPGSERVAVTVEGQEYVLTPRDAVFVSCTEVHSVRALGPGAKLLVVEMGFSLLGDDFFVFAGKKFSEALVHFEQEEACGGSQMKIEKILKEIVQEYLMVEGGVMDWPAINRMRMSSLIFALAASMAEYLPMTPVSAKGIRQMEAVQAVHKALVYVEQMYPQVITLEQAAQITGYEKTRFCQLFKLAVGVPFHKYLNDRRMQAAASLLQGTNLPIARIGEMVGVTQAKTFSRLIRERYGVTPSELRKQGTKNKADSNTQLYEN